MNTQRHYDIFIVGAGIVGSTLACLLAQETPLSIGLIETSPPKPIPTPYDLRVSAITPASKNLFNYCGIWPLLPHDRQAAYQHMHIWDENSGGELRFNAHKIFRNELGFIIENAILREAILKRVQSLPSIDFICPAKVESIEHREDGVDITLNSRSTFKTNLLIGADGAHSWVRKTYPFEINETPYNQHAFVANVETQMPHHNTAYQRFLNTGPVAFLPFQHPHHSSIVWSCDNALHEKLTSLDKNAFAQQLMQAFQAHLGAVTVLSDIAAFPLIKRQVKQPYQDHVLLIGDAAHTIHPLAGQGVNLGLKDIASLSHHLTNAINAKKNPFSERVLTTYARERTAVTHEFLFGMDFLKTIFSQTTPTINTLRSCGLKQINRSSTLKYHLVYKAMGFDDHTPRTMQSQNPAKI